jgi:tRNA (guanine37-N1)-methyltransferase
VAVYLQTERTKMLQFDIITIFPKSINSFLQEGIFRIAQEKEAVKIRVHDLRNWTHDTHRKIDDTPYGGGAGMVMKIEPIDRAISDLRKTGTKVIAMTPRGVTLNQKNLKEFVSQENQHYIIIAGHYEGIDERVYENLVDYEISIGDFVLSGGELPALAFVDAYIRLLPGVLGNEDSNKDESFENDTLEYPQYTRPEEYDGMKVPDVLLSGNHEKIKKWREQEAKRITKLKRPDLLK